MPFGRRVNVLKQNIYKNKMQKDKGENYENKTAIIISSILFICGVFIHRYLLMPGGFNYTPLTIDVNGLHIQNGSMPVSLG